MAQENLSDGDARARLQQQIDDAEAAHQAVVMLSAGRDSYVKDRAYRLLSAAVDQTDVRPIDPGLRENFLREEALGRMALGQAFDELAGLEPELQQLVVGESTPRDRKQRMRELVGLNARNRDPLLRSELASSIVAQYIAIGQGRIAGDLAKPYFEDRRTGASSGYLLGGEPRPKAAK